MAVFTRLDRVDIANFLTTYPTLGGLVEYEGVTSGVENTTYKLNTTKGPFILTIFENRRGDDDPALMASYMSHLSAKRISCPTFVANRHRQIIAEIKDKPAGIQTFMKGRGVPQGEITESYAKQVGDLLGRMHLAGQDFTSFRSNPVGFKTWVRLAQKVIPRADEVEPGLSPLIAQVLTELTPLFGGIYPQNLPNGAVHGDVFPDNVFFDAGKLSGIIDFGFTCRESWLYDFCIAFHAWAYDANGVKQEALASSMRRAYQAQRALSAAENQAFKLMGQAAALRILLTRLHDWLYPADADTINAKDPRPYANIIRSYRVK